MAKGLDILVVDDNEDNADSLAELFELEGHRVQVAYSGEQAIVAYAARHFDLAFMDVMMPGKNGVESFLEIKSMKPAAKVFMMTGYSVDQLLQQAIQNGALGVLAKPVDIDELMLTISDVAPGGIVLVAEDDPDFGPSLQQVIAGTGRRCELVTNGADALARVEESVVEVLILDLDLPLISGIEVVTTLHKCGKGVPTIIITGCIDKYDDVLDALSDVQVTGILNKPFDVAELLGKLEQLCA